MSRSKADDRPSTPASYFEGKVDQPLFVKEAAPSGEGTAASRCCEEAAEGLMGRTVCRPYFLGAGHRAPFPYEEL